MERKIFYSTIRLWDSGVRSLFSMSIALSLWCYKYSRPLCILPIAFVVGKTISTVIGVEYNIPIILCLFVVKALSIFSNKRIITFDKESFL